VYDHNTGENSEGSEMTPLPRSSTGVPNWGKQEYPPTQWQEAGCGRP